MKGAVALRKVYTRYALTESDLELKLYLVYAVFTAATLFIYGHSVSLKSIELIVSYFVAGRAGIAGRTS